MNLVSSSVFMCHYSAHVPRSYPLVSFCDLASPGRSQLTRLRTVVGRITGQSGYTEPASC